MAASSTGMRSPWRAWKRVCERRVTFCSGVPNACVTAAAVPRTRTPWPLAETMARPRAVSASFTAAMSSALGPNRCMKSSGCSHWWYRAEFWSCCWAISASSCAVWRSGR